MRRTLTALVLFSATLFILQILPQKRAAVVRVTGAEGETIEQWVQTTKSDFDAGTLDCLALGAIGDGEISLATEHDAGYCMSGLFTSRIHQASVLFNIVGAAWGVDEPMGTTFEMEVRVSRDRDQWSDWMRVLADEDGPGSEPLVHGTLLEVSPSRYLQYRLTLGTFEPGASPLVRELVLTVMNTQEGPTVDEARATILPQETTSAVPQPRIISRKGWGANEAWATRETTYRKPTHFVIHHTVTPNNPQDPAYIVRAVYQYHAVSRGWGDVGYNFLIDHLGNIYEGRKGGDGVVGIHAGDYNYGSIGIALLGDYRTVEMTPAMKEALISLMAWEADRFGIHPLETSFFVHRDFPNVVAHRDLWTTVCPGDTVYRVLPELRKVVWQRMLDRSPRVEIISPEAGQSVSGEVEVLVSSPSPTTTITRLRIDGSLKAEGQSEIRWVWDTRQVSEGQHLIEVIARSIDGEKTRVARQVIVDNTAPTGCISIDGGAAYTSRTDIVLELSADDGMGEIAGMQFTQDGAAAFTEMEEFVPSRDWVLAGDDGRSTIGVRFVDQAGNVSPTYTASTFLDTNPPRDWGRVDTADAQLIVVGVVDDGSGLDPESARLAVSTDGGVTWGEWQVIECDSVEGQASVGACYMTAEIPVGAARFRISDKAGNEAYSPAYGEVVVPQTPEPTTSTSPEPGTTPTVPATPVAMPDLVVDSITVAPDPAVGPDQIAVTVTVRNDGPVEAANGFWVELFVDPPVAPTVNSVTITAGQGALWYVPRLASRESLTLSLDQTDDRYSNFVGRLSAGRHELYVYVDAYNTEGQAGLVVEADESNNLGGPFVVEIDGGPNGEPEPAQRSPRELLFLLIRRLEQFLSRLRARP